MDKIQYSIRKNRLDKALCCGIEVDEDGKIICSNELETHYMILPIIDSGTEDCNWGRLKFSMHLPQDSVVYLYVAATDSKDGQDLMCDKEVGITQKKQFLSSLTCLRFLNKSDVLLYEITGRYLWVCIEIIGSGVMIENMCIEAGGDNFMPTFPEVYREKNSFFHRYISIFSSVSNDFSHDIEHRDYLLDISTAPKKLIELYIKWIGIDINGGFLDENILRNLLKEAPFLIKYKGTRQCIERICELLLGEKPIITERGLMEKYIKVSEREVYNSLYGDSVYDVTLFLSNTVDEVKREQVLHLLRQFKPVRTKLHIVFLENKGILDEHTYLDQNAFTFMQNDGGLDIAQIMDGTIILQ